MHAPRFPTRILALALFAALLPVAAHAGAQNLIVVTTTDDALDAFDGLCSLREALHNANTNTQFSPVVDECPAGSGIATDVIELATGVTYSLTRVGLDDDAGDLDILDDPDLAAGIVDVELLGNSGDGTPLISQSVAAERVLEIHGADVRINRVGLRDGEAELGGGIRNDGGSLHMFQSAAIFNSAGTGGGIHSTGPLLIEGGGASYNTAGVVGGGVAQIGASLTVRDAYVVDNEAVFGGGIHADGASLSVGQTWFVANATQWSGAGINSVNVVSLDVEGSTFLDNVASGDGGAVRALTAEDVFFRDNEFITNKAANGGALDVQGVGDARITGGRFGGNTASSDGGAVRATRVRTEGTSYLLNVAGGDGGGIAGSISVRGNDIVLSGNHAQRGGGVHVQQAMLERSRVDGNSADGDGGGIAVASRVGLVDTLVIGNTAGGDGGGIWHGESNTTDGRVLRSLVEANVAQGDGGGIWLAAGPRMTFANSTLSGNAAANGQGSAVFIDTGATVLAVNATFADNAPGETIAKFGTLEMKNSLISAPGGTGCIASLDEPAIVSLGNNLSGDTSCFGLDDATDLVNVDVLLAPLAWTSATMRTHALLPGSPAIDRGDGVACDAAPIDAVDQRGGARDIGLACDIGAHEQGAVVSMTLFGDGFEGD